MEKNRKEQERTGKNRRRRERMKGEVVKERYDIAVIGGGIAGLCAAVTAAREGAKTVLVQNRPVLGGNASSEIRMHIVGADFHGTRPDARETGLLEEILLEHKHRNPENSWAIFDSILWEKAAFQENLTLHLNTHMTRVFLAEENTAADGCKEGFAEERRRRRIAGVRAVQLTTEKELEISARIFVDATGDGTLAVWAGAETKTGRESKTEYGEEHGQETADDCTMGNSLMLKARDMGHPVTFVRPFWANHYTEEDLKRRRHSEISSGYWWIELGGDGLDVIRDGEIIRDELLKAVYGVWDHIKNGGRHGAENYELEWVGFLPGKRESRRVMGDYVLREQDCSGGARFQDAVAYGGWPMDLHVAGGLESREESANTFLKLEDVYTIPYRCYYSRDVENLMMAGRIISSTHMAFASVRTMGTCAVGGQAVGAAAALAVRENLLPGEVGKHMTRLQQSLLRMDCYLPGIAAKDPLDLAPGAKATASGSLPGCGPEQVINGWGRPVGNRKNCWQATEEHRPWIQLHFPETVRAGRLQILFDSNLSREIMISLSEEKLQKQQKGTPAELVRDFTLTFFQDGQIVRTWKVSGNYQRRCVVNLGEQIACDSIRLTVEETHGTRQPKIFEIRVYEQAELPCSGMI